MWRIKIYIISINILIVLRNDDVSKLVIELSRSGNRNATQDTQQLFIAAKMVYGQTRPRATNNNDQEVCIRRERDRWKVMISINPTNTI